MLRTFATAVMLLALLTLPLPDMAVAGPPEKVPGAMAFDGVGPGLDRYGKEKDPEKRLKMLEKLAPTRDPRVAVLLGGYLEGPDLDLELASAAIDVLGRYYVLGRSYLPSSRPARDRVIIWWYEHKADLRCRAQQPPG